LGSLREDWDGILRQIVVTDYADLLAALRQRKEELNASMATIDEVAGLPQGYVSKLLAQIKGISRTSLGPLLGALGLKLLVVEDPEALDRVRDRLTQRDEADVRRLETRMRNAASE
jgi:hypothetical protein